MKVVRWVNGNPMTTQRRRQESVRATKSTGSESPSRSFPDAEMLVVVRRADTDLYEYLLPRFAGMPGLMVILDRRRPDGPVDERDREERRIRPGTLSALGYTVVRFKRAHPRE